MLLGLYTCEKCDYEPVSMPLQSAEGTADGVEDSSGKAAGKKGDNSQAGYRASSLSCFGMPNVVDDDEAVVEIIIEVRSVGQHRYWCICGAQHPPNSHAKSTCPLPQ